MKRYIELLKDSDEVILIKNEQHSLLNNQEVILKEKIEKYQVLNIPKEGISTEQQKELAKLLIDTKKEIIFLSPIPFLFGSICKYSEKTVYVFCNSKRNKEEKNKEIKFKLENEGWELVEI